MSLPVCKADTGEALLTATARARETVAQLRDRIAAELGIEPHIALELHAGERSLAGSGGVTLKEAGLVDGATISVTRKRGLILTASADHSCVVWDLKSGHHTCALRGHADAVHAAAFSPDNRLIATASHDRTVRLWNGENGANLHSITGGHSATVSSVAFSPDGALLASGSWDKTAKVWDVTKLVAEAERRSTAAEEAEASAANQWSMSMAGHSDSVSSVSFHPLGYALLSGSLDGTAKTWDLSSGKSLQTFAGHSDAVRSAVFSPCGSFIATGSLDRTAKIFNASDGKPRLTLEGHRGGVHSVSYSPDGAFIVTSSRDKTAKVWSSTSGECVLTLKGHGDAVYAASFSSNGRCIVTGSSDCTGKVWDAQSGECTLTLAGHREAVRSAVVSHL